MRSSLLLVTGLWLFCGCQERVPAALKYGAPLSLSEKTKVSRILAAPENYLGKKVLVQGKVMEVCAKAGCWMELASDRADEKIKVKVNDGEIVFPMTAKGKTAHVEGEVYKIELSEQEARGYLAHLAEEQGIAFDASGITGPMTIYQIKGLGAEIEK